MSFYLLHILREGNILKKYRGNLICEHRESGEFRQIALEDLRGVILAAPDLLLSDQLIRSILSNDAFIMHCNEKFQPIGLTMPLERLTRPQVAAAQAKATNSLKSAIWSLLLYAKIHNQMNVLKLVKGNSGYLTRKIKEKPINESACARFYWREYFKSLGFDNLTRRHHQEHLMNGMLNYGYAVLGAICHRSLVAHGLSPLFGVQHQGNFHGNPLVYDLIEPWRPFIDYHLSLHIRQHPQSGMEEWIKGVRTCWEHLVSLDNGDKHKLVDAMDHCVQSLASAFNEKKKDRLWLPQITGIN